MGSSSPIHWAFISVTGISHDGGVYCQRALVEDKRQVIRAAQQAIVFVANHSRIGNQSGEQFVTFDELKALIGKGDRAIAITLVTDDHINNCSLENCTNPERSRLFSAELQKLHNAGIHVITVPISTNGKPRLET
jgi:hypothetical protein